MSPVVSQMLALSVLLLVSTGTYLLSRKTRFPYTVLLVVIGLLFIPLTHFGPTEFLGAFTLTPDLLFYIFLPTLIFESAYNMHLRRVLENIRGITLLSVASLLLSAFFVAFVLYAVLGWFGYAVPFSVTLLFGALISATDPVAVLALFKEYGAPKRLTLLFEGESLFNDGTSLALFLVVLELVTKGWSGMSSISDGVLSFLVMVLGGGLFGVCMGYTFSYLFRLMRGNEYLEITLTMVIAHVTFISTELVAHAFQLAGVDIHLSAIIATTIAAMVVGNFGRQQLTPKVAEYMEHFWGYFAFVANSIIFILIGLLFADLPAGAQLIMVPVFLAIVVVMIGRALSIYPVVALLNWWGKEEGVPMSWQHALAWGSLRGALAVTMVLLIPEDFTVHGWTYAFSVRDFLIGLTIGCIFFTMFIKATTIGPLIKKLRIDKLSPLEEAEREEVRMLVYAKVLLEIARFRGKQYISDQMFDMLKSKYHTRFTIARQEHADTLRFGAGISEQLLSLYATCFEKHSLKTLYTYGEVNDVVYRYALAGLSERQEAQERGVPCGAPSLPLTLPKWASGSSERFMYYRARMVTAHKAWEELLKIAEVEPGLVDGGDLERVRKSYQDLEYVAKKNMEEVVRLHADEIAPLQRTFAEAGILKAEDRILEDLSEKEIISPKVEALLRAELDEARGATS